MVSCFYYNFKCWFLLDSCSTSDNANTFGSACVNGLNNWALASTFPLPATVSTSSAISTTRCLAVAFDTYNQSYASTSSGTTYTISPLSSSSEYAITYLASSTDKTLVYQIGFYALLFFFISFIISIWIWKSFML